MPRLGPLCVVLLPGLSGCSSVILAGGPGYDVGSFGVPGFESGIGGQIEIIRYPRAANLGLGLGAAFQLAGYQTAADADPIGFTTFDVRYRRPLGTTAARRPYWEVGSGVGIAWSAGIRAAAVPLQGEIGVQRQTGPMLLSIGLRERFLGLIGSGSPPLDAFNSLQVVFGVRFGEERGSAASFGDSPAVPAAGYRPPAVRSRDRP